MDGKTLLQIALDKLSPDQLNWIVENTGLRFRVQGQWVSFKEGMLRDDSGNPVMTGAGAISGVAFEGEEDQIPATRAPVQGALASGVNAPVIVKPDMVKAVAGAAFQPRGTTAGEGAGTGATEVPPATAGPQLGAINVHSVPVVEKPPLGPQEAEPSELQKRAEQNQGQEAERQEGEPVNLAAQANQEHMDAARRAEDARKTAEQLRAKALQTDKVPQMGGTVATKVGPSTPGETPKIAAGQDGSSPDKAKPANEPLANQPGLAANAPAAQKK
jgi:hypothetical protein